MNTILLRLRRALRTTADQGASAVEYGLMVAAIAALIAGTVFALGGFVKKSFDDTCSALTNPKGGTCATTTTPAPAAT